MIKMEFDLDFDYIVKYVHEDGHTILETINQAGYAPTLNETVTINNNLYACKGIIHEPMTAITMVIIEDEE